jgi:serine/threonine protein kinase
MPEVRDNLVEVYGQSIGNIDILRKLGRGASSDVFLCRNGSKEKTCAVKVFKKSEIKTYDKLSQIVCEHEILRKLKHPNIAEGINFVHGLKNMYLFMEFVGTSNLFQMIRSAGEQGVSWPKAKELFLHIFRGADYMHGMEIAHCDLKPENIVISADGCAKLIDFGQAITLDDIPPLTNPRGTMPFMSPEMLYVSKTLDPIATDLWSLGVIMVEVLCGNHVFSDILGWRRNMKNLAEFRQCADELMIRFASESKDGLLQGIVFLCNSNPAPCVRPMLSGLLELSPASRLSAKHMVEYLEETAHDLLHA